MAINMDGWDRRTRVFENQEVFHRWLEKHRLYRTGNDIVMVYDVYAQSQASFRFSHREKTFAVTFHSEDIAEAYQ